MAETVLKHGDMIDIVLPFSGSIQIIPLGPNKPVKGNGFSTVDGKKVVHQKDLKQFEVVNVIYSRGAFNYGMGKVLIMESSLKLSQVTKDGNVPVVLADSQFKVFLKIDQPAFLILPNGKKEDDPFAKVVDTAGGAFMPLPKLNVKSA
ncbi:MAG: hypothetical protein AAFQ98_21565 [Bacteroidota bacterium]